jgi:hypothetical protein
MQTSLRHFGQENDAIFESFRLAHIWSKLRHSPYIKHSESDILLVSCFSTHGVSLWEMRLIIIRFLFSPRYLPLSMRWTVFLLLITLFMMSLLFLKNFYSFNKYKLRELKIDLFLFEESNQESCEFRRHLQLLYLVSSGET